MQATSVMSHSSNPLNVVLVGFMGTGKTTVGKSLEDLAGLDLVDLDQVIVQEAGRTIPEIFAAEGEAAFRDLETAALQSMETRRGCVVATGGGIVGRPENWTTMRRLGTVVYLQTAWDTLKSRLSGDTGRPLADTREGWDDLEALWRKRLPLYEQADLVVDCAGLSPEEIAQKIMIMLEMERISHGND